MNYSDAAAANLTSIQEFGCKHPSAPQNTCHTRATARLVTWLVVFFLHNGMRCPRATARLVGWETCALG